MAGRDEYNTKLTPEQEKAFQAWMQSESQRRGRNVANDLQDYDLRGNWAANGGPLERPTQSFQVVPDQSHMGDTFKKPNHPTFSDESQYSGQGGHVGGHWDETSQTYTPSPQMLAGTHDLALMKRYFDEAEPDYKVRQPPVDLAMIERRKQETQNTAPFARPLAWRK